MAIGDLTFKTKIVFTPDVYAKGCVVDMEYHIVFIHLNTGYLNSYRYNALGDLTPLDSQLGAGESIGMAIDTTNKIIFTAKNAWVRSWNYDSDGNVSQSLYLNSPVGGCYSISIDNTIDFGGGNVGGIIFRGVRSSGVSMASYYDDISSFWNGPNYNTAGIAYHSAPDTGRRFLFLADSGQGLISFKYTLSSITYVNIAGSGTMRGYQGVGVDTVNKVVFVGAESNGLQSYLYDDVTAIVSLVSSNPVSGSARGVIVDAGRMLAFAGVEGIYSYRYSDIGVTTPIDNNLNLNNGGSDVEAIGIDTEWGLLFEVNGKSSVPVTTGELRVLSYEIEAPPNVGGQWSEGFFI